MSETAEMVVKKMEPLGFGQAIQLMNQTDKLIEMALSPQQQQTYRRNYYDLIRVNEINPEKPSDLVAYKLYAQAMVFSKDSMPTFDPTEAKTINLFQKNGLLDSGRTPNLRSIQHAPSSEQRQKDLKDVGFWGTASRIWNAHFGFRG